MLTAVDESLLENDIYSIAELSADDMVRAEQLFRSSSSSQSMEGGVHKDSITNGGDAAFGNNTESNITLKGVDSVSVNTSGGGGRSIDLLRPFGFANRLSDGPVLNQVLLSPRAFAMTLLSPRFMRVSGLIFHVINLESFLSIRFLLPLIKKASKIIVVCCVPGVQRKSIFLSKVL